MRRRALSFVLLGACLLALVAVFAVGLHWPLVGDSVLMHYVVWLTWHGFAPYRDIAEMNLPFTYMSEGAAMALFGSGDLGWRLYDGSLVLLIVIACWRLLPGKRAAAGVAAATVFAAVHLQDGIHMAGQRDLLVTLLQAGAALALLWGNPPRPPALARPGAVSRPVLHARAESLAYAMAGALGVAAAAIKPTAVLFIVAACAGQIAFRTSRRLSSALWAAAGGLVPLSLSLLYLWRYGAVGAFLQDVHGLIAYHASIERRSMGFLLSHAWSPVLPLLVATALALGFNRSRLPWTGGDRIAAIGAVTGLLSYLLQGKGFPYQRYPMLLWLLLLCASRVWAAAQTEGSRTAVQRAALALPPAVAAVLVVLFLSRSTHFSHADPYAGLRADLRSQHAIALDGRVQCLDTAGPCIGALLKEHLTQSTGFLYDCYLLHGSNPVVQQQRQMFMRQWQANPPDLLVLTDSNCFTGPRGFDKYADWPWMNQQLAGYRLAMERHPSQPLRLWSRPEQPYAYRILARRP